MTKKLGIKYVPAQRVLPFCITFPTRIPHQGVPDHPKKQSGVIFCQLNDHCVAFKIARQFWIILTGR